MSPYFPHAAKALPGLPRNSRHTGDVQIGISRAESLEYLLSGASSTVTGLAPRQARLVVTRYLISHVYSRNSGGCCRHAQ
jgi:hypothetical protein